MRVWLSFSSVPQPFSDLFAAEMGIIRAEFETDSQLLAEALDIRTVDSSPFAAAIEDTKYRLKLWFSKHVIKFCRRSANSVAYELASLGRMYPENYGVEWESDVPAQVDVCVAGDMPEHR